MSSPQSRLVRHDEYYSISLGGGSRCVNPASKLSIANLRIIMMAGFSCSRADDRGKATEHLNFTLVSKGHKSISVCAVFPTRQ